MNDDSGQQPSASRFPTTGDDRVDLAVARLPEPQLHVRPNDMAHAPEGTADASEAGDGIADHGTGQRFPGAPGSLPDPALLDEHIGEVTAVHRELQQRLSDLSG